MNLNFPPKKDSDRFDDYMFLLYKFVTAPQSGITETNHAALGNLNSTDFSHLTSTQLAGLVLGFNTALHYHSADRDRSNHTGVQPASTINDFLVAVNQVTQNAHRQGVSVAAANNLTLGTDGDYFQITGATQVNLLDVTSLLGGAWITLKFNSTPTVKHNQAASGNFKPIMLAGAADFVATANDTLSLRYDATDAKWYQTSSAVI